MLSLLAAPRIFLALAPIDGRKSFNGLSTLAQETLQQEPTSGFLFVFLNKARNRLKVLCWDGSGLVLCTKRLERGTFALPVGEGHSQSLRPEELGTLRLDEVGGVPAERGWVAAALRQFHYLGFAGPVGQNLQYVVRDGSPRPVAALVFGAAAWKCQDWDRFLGWSAQHRPRNLGLVANNSRFLILPWVRVPHLASRILGQIQRRIAADWPAFSRHPACSAQSARGLAHSTSWRRAPRPRFAHPGAETFPLPPPRTRRLAALPNFRAWASGR